MFLTHIITLCTIAHYFVVHYFWNRRIFFRKILQLLRDKNIIFTKIFQSLANNTRLALSTDFREELRSYGANVSYTQSEIDYDCIDAIERDYDVVIDRQVVNSGMIALVFNGRRDGSEPIILKLKRRNITAHLQSGCNQVTAAYNVAAYWFPHNIVIRILKPFISNIDDIISQCDFDKEIHNLRTAKEDFAILDFVHIPTVYNEDRDRDQGREQDQDQDQDQETKFILMERIEGIHSLPPNTPEAARFLYLEKMSIFAAYGFLYNAIQHTDLHHGNILFLPNGDVGIIDYGMAIQPSEPVHEIILSIASVIKSNPPLHEIDFLTTFKDIFEPPLIKDELEDQVTIEDICISIAQPLIEAVDFDELNFTDNMDRLAEHLGHDVVLNRDIYKLLLGFTMMGPKFDIFGPSYPCPEKIIAVEKLALNKAFALIM